MKEKVRIFLIWTAFVYAVVCLCQAVIIPVNHGGFLDNLLFPFALITFGYGLVFDKTVRWISIPFLTLFVYTVVVNFSLKTATEASGNLMYQMYFLKWPVVFVSFYLFFKEFSARLSFRELLMLTFYALVSINCFLVIDPFGLGEWVQNFYSTKPLTNFYYFHEAGAFRLSGTQMNPNENAIIFSFFFVYFLKFSPRWYLLLMSGIMIFLCQSRTGIILVLFILILWAINNMIEKGQRKNLWRLLLGIIAVGIVGSMFSTNFKSIANGEAFRSNSLMIRLNNYLTAFDVDTATLWTGRGVLDDPLAQLGVYIDAELVAIIMQYGLIGLLIWLIVLMVPIAKLKYAQVWSSYVFWLTILIFGNCLTNFVYLNPTLGTVTMLFLVGACQFPDKLSGNS